MGFWEEGNGRIKLVISGDGTVRYLYHILQCLHTCGISSTINQQTQQTSAPGYLVQLESITGPGAVIEAVCCQIPPHKAVESLQKESFHLQTASHIINLLPIKWFPEFRYNVDSSWAKVDQWVKPLIYQRALHALSGSSTQISWVLTEAEKAGISSGFFDHPENHAVFTVSPEQLDGKEPAMQAVIENFLNDIGEETFCQQMGENEFAGFGFSASGADGYLVSESANRFWLLRSVLPVLKSAGMDRDMVLE